MSDNQPLVWETGSVGKRMSEPRDSLGIVDRMAASIAHELNQPLTAILSNAQAALHILQSESPNYAEIKDILNDIVFDDKRAGEIIRRLRVLMKQQSLDLRLLQANDLIRDVVHRTRGDARLHHAFVQMELGDDLPLFYGDEVLLQQALLNLVLNGLDAMKETPWERKILSIRSGRDGVDRIKIAVEDRGHGIAQPQMLDIFSPFFTTKKEGLGLGLSITRSIVDGHHGQVWAENLSDGAAFILSLPLDPKAQKEVPLGGQSPCLCG